MLINLLKKRRATVPLRDRIATLNGETMHYLECSNCGHLNEVNNEFVEFCSKCKKKMDSSFSSWQIQNPEKTFEEYKRLVCISEEEAHW